MHESAERYGSNVEQGSIVSRDMSLGAPRQMYPRRQGSRTEAVSPVGSISVDMPRQSLQWRLVWGYHGTELSGPKIEKESLSPRRN